jgi:hypothetical protein
LGARPGGGGRSVSNRLVDGERVIRHVGCIGRKERLVLLVDPGRGIRPGTGLSEVIFAGAHNKVIAAVLDRRVDAGAIYEGAVRVAKAAGARKEDLSILASTDPIAVRTGLEAIPVRRIQGGVQGIHIPKPGRQ